MDRDGEPTAFELLNGQFESRKNTISNFEEYLPFHPAFDVEQEQSLLVTEDALDDLEMHLEKSNQTMDSNMEHNLIEPIKEKKKIVDQSPTEQQTPVLVHKIDFNMQNDSSSGEAEFKQGSGSKVQQIAYNANGYSFESKSLSFEEPKEVKQVKFMCNESLDSSAENQKYIEIKGKQEQTQFDSGVTAEDDDVKQKQIALINDLDLGSNDSEEFDPGFKPETSNSKQMRRPSFNSNNGFGSDLKRQRSTNLQVVIHNSNFKKNSDERNEEPKSGSEELRKNMSQLVLEDKVISPCKLYGLLYDALDGISEDDEEEFDPNQKKNNKNGISLRDDITPPSANHKEAATWNRNQVLSEVLTDGESPLR